LNRAYLTLFWLASLAILLIESKVTNTYGSSIKPTVMLYCLASFLCFYTFALILSTNGLSANKLISWISSQSFFIYLSHLIFLTVLKSPAVTHKFGHLWHGNVGMILLFLAVVILDLLFTYLTSILPIASWLGGVYFGFISAPY
jgi:hypothetical protein